MLHQGQRCKELPDRLEWLCNVCVACSPNAVKVASALAMACNSRTGQCNPSRKMLSEITGISETNVSHALAALKKMGWVKRRTSGHKRAQWDLHFPGSQVCVATPCQVLAATPDTSLTVVEQGKEEPKSQSSRINTARANPWSAWEPTPEQETDFYEILRLTTEDLRREISEFKNHNIREGSDFRKQATFWDAWIKQIRRLQLKHETITVQPEQPKKTKPKKTVQEIFKMPFACWKRLGPYVDPEKDPSKFIATGCSQRADDPCNCNRAKRKDIVERIRTCRARR